MKVISEYSDLDKHEDDDGNITYYKKGTDIRHNPYGPAYIRNNVYKVYWIENEIHRLDGPAIIWNDGLEEYWINHIDLTKEDFEIHTERLKYLGKGHLICLM